MNPLEVIKLKKAHLERLANQSGAEGEAYLISEMDNWVPRPKGKELKRLLAALLNQGMKIKPTSFDAIYCPPTVKLNFEDINALEQDLHKVVFIEIKTANQDRVKEDFKGFFFALTENEIIASELLGERHKVVFFNKKNGNMLVTSVPEIVSKSRSMTWQVSVQL